MSYFENLQKAIDYIEDNLTNHLQISEISKAAGYSIPHFYRVFNAFVGCSVKEYVRKRKLSEAMYEICTTRKSIISIALDHGFESHEVFSRTFKSVYGMSPSQFRKGSKQPSMYERVHLLSQKHESRLVKMNPEIIYKDKMQIVGIARKINQSDNVTQGLIPKIRHEFMQVMHMIKNRVDDHIYFAAYDYDPLDISKEDEAINYIYYYGVEASSIDTIPQDMVIKTIPAGKYAVFLYDHQKATLNGEPLEGSVYDYIDGVWLVNSGYELSDHSDYEVIDTQKELTEIYISII